MRKDGAHTVGDDRPPRAHIEYDVYTGGAAKSVELPFVIGVMSNLSGKTMSVPRLPENPTPEDRANYEERKQAYEAQKRTRDEYRAVDSSNFDKYLAAACPAVSMKVPNVLSPEEGDLAISLDFQSMEDFSPDAVARRIGPLRKLLEHREALANLLAYMDGKDDAEKAVQDFLEKYEALMAQE